MTTSAYASVIFSSNALLRRAEPRRLGRRIERMLMAPLPFKVGDTVLDHYCVEEIYGDLGSVWYMRASYEMARQVQYALQVFPFTGVQECPMLAHFLEEGARVARLPCPPFVKVFRSGVDSSGHGILVRELVEGLPLNTVLAQRERTSIVKFMRILEGVVGEVAEAHARGDAFLGLTYRDIVLADNRVRNSISTYFLHATVPWGAKCHDPVRTRGPMSVHVSPQFRATSEASVVNDIYSLGMLTVALIIGADIELYSDHRAPELLERYGPFADLIYRALAPDVEDRIPDTSTFLALAREAAIRAQVARLADHGADEPRTTDQDDDAHELGAIVFARRDT